MAKTSACTCLTMWAGGKSDNGTRCSQAVTHPSTNRARCCLTSVIGRELVFSAWYGRCQRSWREMAITYRISVSGTTDISDASDSSWCEFKSENLKRPMPSYFRLLSFCLLSFFRIAVWRVSWDTNTRLVGLWDGMHPFFLTYGCRWDIGILGYHCMFGDILPWDIRAYTRLTG